MMWIALLFLAAPQYSDFCNAEIGRMTVAIDGREAESFIIRNDSPNRVTGKAHWVESGGVWYRTDTPEEYADLSPTFRLDGDSLIYEYTIGEERVRAVWGPCD